jgi:preprotein translocase subunit SecG
LKIIAPLYSYAGFSIAGIGDINSDGYDDLAIGSVPYDRGKHCVQRTYIIYGRRFVANETILELSQITSEDGIIITGGGFLVTGVGDVNADSVADVMISSYFDWKGRNSAYLISTPANMTYSPSLQPSSSPTMIPTGNPTYSPTLALNSTFSPTKLPSFRPSYAPVKFNSTLTPTRAVFAIGTSRPSSGKPSLAPSLTPTSGYHRLRGFPTIAPSLISTMMPTINTTVFTEILCSDENEYQGQNGTHYLFRITANTGTVKLNGNLEGEAKNIYVLYCPRERVNVVIQNFRLSTDIISVAHLIKTGYTYSSLNDISYSKSDPLTILFCSDNKLQVLLPSHTEFDLQEDNFLFTQKTGYDAKKHTKNKTNTTLARVQTGVVLAVLFFLLSLFLALAYQNKQEEEKKLKNEEQWLNSLKVPTETLHIYPAYRGSENHEVHDESIASDPTLVVNLNINRETVENQQSSRGFSSPASSSSYSRSPFQDQVSQYDNIFSIGSINSGDWQDALAVSDDDEDEQQLQEQSVSWVALFANNTHLSHGSSSSSASSSGNESQLPSEVSFMISAVMEVNDNISDCDVNSIYSDEWQNALIPSEDEESCM